jgi:hypothetical protein
MAKTLRTLVESWVNDWNKLYLKGKHTESLYMYIAHKTIEWSKQ